MKYYAVTNYYASESSVGFRNTWSIHVFRDRKSRNSFVDSRSDLATRAIKRSEISTYHDDPPKPFSSERYIIVKDIFSAWDGYIGYVETSDRDHPGYVCDLY